MTETEPAMLPPLLAALGTPDTEYLTVIFRGVQPGEEAHALTAHPKMSACSWSHAIHDRDAARAALSAEPNPHTDHPFQHWDRTCPACIAEASAAIAAERERLTP